LWITHRVSTFAANLLARRSGPSVFERFDESAHAVVDRAQQEAIALGADHVDAVHLLLALCWADDQGTHQLRLSGLTADGVRGYLPPQSAAPPPALSTALPPALSAALSEALAAGDLAEPRKLPFTTQLKMVFHHALQEMAGRRHPGVDWSHLLLGLLRTNPRVRPPRPAPLVHPAPVADPAPAVHPAPVADPARVTGPPPAADPARVTGPPPATDPAPVAGPAPVGDLAEPAETGSGTDRLNSLLADLGVNRGTVAMIAITRADTWAAGEGFPFLGRDLAGLPGRRERWAWPGAVLAVYLVFCVIVLLLAPSPDERIVAAVFLVLGFAVVNTATLVSSRTRIQRRVARADAERVAAPGLTAALAATGVRKLTVALLPPGDRVAGRSAGRAYRAGSSGTIILRPALRRAHPDLARFITAHEAGHVARNDSLSYRLAYGAMAAVLAALVGSGTVWALWLLVPALAGQVWLRWQTELACDRIAATATGSISGAEFLAYLARNDAAMKARPRYPLRRLRALLSHPPDRLRRRAIARAPAPPA
jgi:Zn-dependent protease with chaperone function